MRIPEIAARPGLAERLVRGALEAGDPGAALRAAWGGRSARGMRVLAVGKASVPMAAVVAGDEIEMLLTVVPEHERAAREQFACAAVFACDHPYPSERNVAAAQVVRELVARVAPGETLLVLLSGGGSAHLAMPWEGIPLEELRSCTRAMQLAGATITQLNAVRKHCEVLKGGRLAAECRGSVEALILSDVIGDRLDVIASGPTSPDPTTFADAMGAIERLGLRGRFPLIEAHLRDGVAGRVPETPKPGDARLARVSNTIIASNRRVVEGVRRVLEAQGIAVMGVTHAVEGDASEFGLAMASKALELKSAGGGAWVFGGETTVQVGDATGVGGPSQEAALAGAIALDGKGGCFVLTLSTDGRDGPTDAAGAVVSGETPRRMREAGVDPSEMLARHDSHHALDAVGALIRVDATGTNLNHVSVVIAFTHEA